jgi:phosphate transport system substrate-binding protein
MKMKTIGKVLLSLVIPLIVFSIGLTFFLIAVMGGSAWIYGLIVIVFTVFFAFAPVLKIWNRISPKKFWFSTLAAISAIVAIIGVPLVIDYQDDQVLTIAAPDVDLREYEPFSAQTKAVSLDKQSTLRFTSDLPRLDGATALYPLYSAFVQATYPQGNYNHPTSEVICSKTGTAYKNLINGSVDIIFVAGPSEQQLQAAAVAGKKLMLTPIGYEAFVFFVNAANPVNDITTDQVKGIYAGEIANWKKVGGKNKAIKAFQRPEDSGSQTRLIQLMGSTPLMQAPHRDVVAGMGGIVAQTADYKNYENAIGYSFLFYVTGMLNNDQVKLLAVDGVYPSAESIKNGTYPLNTTFYAVTAGSVNPNTQKFIDWIVSPQGQELVEKTGYIPL